MSGLNIHTVTARVVLWCNRCGAFWESSIYASTRWNDDVRAAAPAFAAGWRVYAASRSQRAYCPACRPTVPMHLVHGTES